LAQATYLPITGYLDRFSRRPSETITAFVSLRTPGSYDVELVEVVSGDPNPDGPGMRFRRLPQVFKQQFEGVFQPIEPGSFGKAPSPPRSTARPTTWTLLFHSARYEHSQVLLSDEGPGGAITLRVSENGVAAQISEGGASAVVVLAASLQARRWYRIWLSIDPGSGKAVLGIVDQDNSPCTVSATAPALPACETVMVARSSSSSNSEIFDGKIEAPAILGGFCASWEDWLELPGLPVDGVWDFAVDIDTSRMHDAGPGGFHGKLVNLPTRGVIGTRWTGREHAWRHAPGEYAAIHFHNDDIDDCRWSPSFEFVVPDELQSGAYAFHLTCADGEDWIPFYVLPQNDGPHSPVAFLAPTFTYTAYANSGWNNRSDECRARAADWKASDYSQSRYPIYGRSTYDKHDDGSGVCLSSRLRPIPSMRPGFLSYFDEHGSGLRHYPADTHILAWLHSKSISFDVVTDEDLHEQGASLLAPYKLVITGTHPEYHTEQTLDGLHDYVNDGGRLAYLGGNGFYWKVARAASLPHVLEIRRAEGGIRTWAAEPGEYYHQLDGNLGGLWRRSRRPPQELVSIGFTAQGPYASGHYRRTEASYEPRFSWVMDGVPDEFGDYGLSGGGAAGFELDRTDATLGTPEGTAVLARSTNLPAGFAPAHEEMLTEAIPLSGGTVADIVRADMIYRENSRGGAVFSVGSITFCGSLWDGKAFQGPVSRILENIVCRLTR
jgi:N,N-dimethylformamidase